MKFFISFHVFSEIDFYRGRGQKARAEGAAGVLRDRLESDCSPNGVIMALTMIYWDTRGPLKASFSLKHLYFLPAAGEEFFLKKQKG